MNIGIIGCGAISDIYLKNLKASELVTVTALADRDAARARWSAKRFEIGQVLSPDELIASPSIDLVLNLTTPDAHFEIARRAAAAGKHVYNEKPLCIDVADAHTLLDQAEKRNVRVGCAPDTVLGAGIQTCRQLIEDGHIGEVVGGVAFMLCPGHESWHPDPAFYYKRGGGPVLDMGPYYISALVTLLGPVERVRSFALTPKQTRTITSDPKKGETIAVEVPTHCAGLLAFERGPVVSVTMSFDVAATQLPPIELWGSTGSLAVPDPNGFGGPVESRVAREQDWHAHPLTEAAPAHNARGLGVEDMARAIQDHQPHRASGALGLHVLEVMTALAFGADDNEITSRP